MIASRFQMNPLRVKPDRRIDSSSPKASTPELQVNAILVRALCESLHHTCQTEGDSPVARAALRLVIQAKRFEQAAIGALPFDSEDAA